MNLIEVQLCNIFEIKKKEYLEILLINPLFDEIINNMKHIFSVANTK